MIRFVLEKYRMTVASAGFTIIELLIAMAIASVVAMSGFALFSSTNQSYMTQEDVGEVQQNVRIAIDRISKDLRVAGYGLPESSSYSLDYGTGTKFTQPLTITDNTTGPDSITIVGVGYEVGKLLGAHSRGEVPPQLCVDLSDGVAKGDIIQNNAVINGRKYVSIDGHYFTELSTGGGAGGGCTKETAPGVTESGIILPLVNALTRDLASGTVYVIQAISYSIVKNEPTMSPPCTSETPCLKSLDHSGLRGTGRQTVAEGIEDIQFAYGLDANNDKKIDDADGDGYDKDDFVNSTTSVKSIAAIRVTVTGKTRRPDIKGAQFSLPAIENRAAGGADGRRKRFMTKVVKLRNPLKGTASN